MKTHDLDRDVLAITIPQSVLFQDLGEEVVLLEVESGEYYGLNEVGARMWSLLQQGQSFSQVLSTLHEEYEASEQLLSADLKQFLNQLKSSTFSNVLDWLQSLKSPGSTGNDRFMAEYSLPILSSRD